MDLEPQTQLFFKKKVLPAAEDFVKVAEQKILRSVTSQILTSLQNSKGGPNVHHASLFIHHNDKATLKKRRFYCF